MHPQWFLSKLLRFLRLEINLFDIVFNFKATPNESVTYYTNILKNVVNLIFNKKYALVHIIIKTV